VMGVEVLFESRYGQEFLNGGRHEGSERNDDEVFMAFCVVVLDNHYEDDSLEEMNAVVIMMAHIQPIDDKADAEPKYDANTLGKVNSSHIHLKSRMHSESAHEHTNHAKLKIVINTSDDDQIDSSIIFDDPYVENNGETDEHDSMLMINLLLLNP
ncbi:hypothetical protein Tco_0942261, partial [Tanacetum coccineum]